MVVILRLDLVGVVSRSLSLSFESLEARSEDSRGGELDDVETPSRPLGLRISSSRSKMLFSSSATLSLRLMGRIGVTFVGNVGIDICVDVEVFNEQLSSERPAVSTELERGAYFVLSVSS